MRRSVTYMLGWNIILYQLVYLLVYANQAIAGVCWETGLCKYPFTTNMSREECCNITGSASISWTPDTNEHSFFWLYILEGARQCRRCHTSCSNVQCGKDRVCRMVDGLPECVCKPQCDDVMKARGPVCGTDGIKYKHYCALQRRNCNNGGNPVEIAYYGRCRKSCKRVHCEKRRTCMEDQNGYPHCVSCSKYCTRKYLDDPQSYICGADGHTYKHECELRAEICRKGRSVKSAYKGRCQANATCGENSPCSHSTKCLINPATRQPVCLSCYNPCISNQVLPVCGSDGNTYTDYCELKRTACETGIFIETRKSGPCRKRSVSLEKGNVSREIAISNKQKQRYLHTKRKLLKRRRQKMKLERRLRKNSTKKIKRRKAKESIHTNKSWNRRRRKDKTKAKQRSTSKESAPDSNF